MGDLTHHALKPPLRFSVAKLGHTADVRHAPCQQDVTLGISPSLARGDDGTHLRKSGWVNGAPRGRTERNLY